MFVTPSRSLPNRSNSLSPPSEPQRPPRASPTKKSSYVLVSPDDVLAPLVATPSWQRWLRVLAKTLGSPSIAVKESCGRMSRRQAMTGRFWNSQAAGSVTTWYPLASDCRWPTAHRMSSTDPKAPLPGGPNLTLAYYLAISSHDSRIDVPTINPESPLSQQAAPFSCTSENHRRGVG